MIALLPSLADQARHLIDLGAAPHLGISPADLAQSAQQFRLDDDAAHPLLVPPTGVVDYAGLMGLVVHSGKAGFVVEDLVDAAEFLPLPELALPAAPYLLTGIERGDEYQSQTPAQALADITARQRTPLTILEGILWALQSPQVIERGNCFMLIASRKPKGRGGYDSRTPALWISNGTGRDGSARRGAAKLGWCWWNNHHTWLGVAHAAGRVGSA